MNDKYDEEYEKIIRGAKELKNARKPSINKKYLLLVGIIAFLGVVLLVVSITQGGSQTLYNYTINCPEVTCPTLSCPDCTCPSDALNTTLICKESIVNCDCSPIVTQNTSQNVAIPTGE